MGDLLQRQLALEKIVEDEKRLRYEMMVEMRRQHAEVLEIVSASSPRAFQHHNLQFAVEQARESILPVELEQQKHLLTDLKSELSDRLSRLEQALQDDQLQRGLQIQDLEKTIEGLRRIKLARAPDTDALSQPLGDVDCQERPNAAVLATTSTCSGLTEPPEEPARLSSLPPESLRPGVIEAPIAHRVIQPSTTFKSPDMAPRVVLRSLSPTSRSQPIALSFPESRSPATPSQLVVSTQPYTNVATAGSCNVPPISMLPPAPGGNLSTPRPGQTRLSIPVAANVRRMQSGPATIAVRMNGTWTPQISPRSTPFAK